MMSGEKTRPKMRGMDPRIPLVLAATIAFAGPAVAQTPLQKIQRHYDKMAEAYTRKDADAFLAHFAPVVTSENFRGGRTERQQFALGLDALFDRSERLRMMYRIQSLQSAPNTIVVIVRSSRIILEVIEGRRNLREGTTDIRHTWKLIKGRWLISDIYRIGAPGYGRRANSPYYWI